MNAKTQEKPSIEPREPLDNLDETLNELYFDNPQEKQKVNIVERLWGGALLCRG